jgi:bifunctional enzyme CysN/CysC
MFEEQLSIVMAGHVDHGKSTVIGRLLAETNALPEGKLEQVRTMCRRNARPFEYAFLLDALKDEQSQGITIDAARCFFRTAQRRYILIDAPGHIEFLKNMLTGASRAEAALLVIDAKEGIRENTKRHGYMLSMLGLRQIAVVVNKMDLVNYDQTVYAQIRRDFSAFLERLQIRPVSFIPVSGMQGVNIATRSTQETPWYQGPSVLEQIDLFQRREFPQAQPFRLPVQDIYKFTAQGDDRRIVTGTIETGTIATGDQVIFQPSGKRSRVKSIEYFHGPAKTSASAGEAPGFTLDTQIYIKPGEWMVRADQPPLQVGTRLRVNLFWMGHDPLVRGKSYKLKLGAVRLPVQLVEVLSIVDAAEQGTATSKQQVDRHDIAEVILETPKPVAFDLVSDIEQTGRLVIVDHYEIAGAGIILANVPTTDSTLATHVCAREIAWKPSAISMAERAKSYGHGAKFVVCASREGAPGERFARALERELCHRHFKAYYLGMDNVAQGLDADLGEHEEPQNEQIRRLGELARIMTDSGQIFITSLADIDDYDIRTLRLLNTPQEIVVIHVGDNPLLNDPPALAVTEGADIAPGLTAVCDYLRQQKVLVDFEI